MGWSIRESLKAVEKRLPRAVRWGWKSEDDPDRIEPRPPASRTRPLLAAAVRYTFSRTSPLNTVLSLIDASDAPQLHVDLAGAQPVLLLYWWQRLPRQAQLISGSRICSIKSPPKPISPLGRS
jgi:hypothetical protein